MGISGFPISTGNGGGGGGVVNRYAGEWDLSIVNTLNIQAIPDPTRSTGFIKLSDDAFEFVGDNDLEMANGYYADGVMANGATTINSGVRCAEALWPSFDALDTFGGLILAIQNNNSNLSDLYSVINGNAPINRVDGIICILFRDMQSNDAYFYLLTVSNSIPDFSNLVTDVVPNVSAGTIFTYQINTDTGEASLIVNNISYSAITNVNLADFANTTFSSSYSVMSSTEQMQNTYPSSFVFDLGTTRDGKLPFMSAIAELQLPFDAADGKVYKAVNGNAVYQDVYINQYDFVEFADNLQKVIVTGRSFTHAQIEQIAQNKITANLAVNGAITLGLQQAVEAAKDVLSEDVDFYQHLTHDIDPEVGLVILVAGDNVTNAVLNLPLIEHQYRGKRLVIVSYITSNDLIIKDSIGNYVGDAITAVNYGDVFEFVAQPSLTAATSSWLRIK